MLRVEHQCLYQSPCWIAATKAVKKTLATMVHRVPIDGQVSSDAPHAEKEETVRLPALWKQAVKEGSKMRKRGCPAQSGIGLHM